MKCIFFLLVLQISMFAAISKKLNTEIGIGLVYTPKATITKQNGSDKQVLFSRGFVAFQPSFSLLYNMNKAHTLGLCFTLVNTPWYYYYDISETAFSNKYPKRSKKNNTQTSNRSFDIGLAYRYYYKFSNKFDLVSDINPNLKFNISQDTKHGETALEPNDSLNIYEVNFNKFHWLSSSIKINVGIRKMISPKKYIGLGCFWYYTFQEYKGTYTAMYNQPEQSSGLIKHRQFQIGFKFFIGL